MASADVKRRWTNATAGSVLGDAAQIRRMPQSPFGMSSSGLPDYRGFPFQEAISQSQDQHRDVVGWAFREVDFSQADFSNLSFVNCTFENVLLDKSNHRGGSEHGCRFTGSSFAGADLRQRVIGYDGSVYHGCDFGNSDLRGTAFIRPEFNDCRFERSVLQGVDFNGSSFESCTFSGTLHSVWFRNGFPSRRHRKLFGTPRPNHMANVDFSEAELRDVVFTGGIDLSTVSIPTDGRHHLFDRWNSRLRCALDRLSDTQINEDNDVADLLRFLLRQAEGKQVQKWYILNVDDLRNLAGAYAEVVNQLLLDC